MKNLEKFSAIFFVAGLGSFFLALGVLGIWPSMMASKMTENSGLPQSVPANFQVYYKNNVEQYHAALLKGRDIYVKEACWHCHSQYVRPVSNEKIRYGLISTAGEYENILNRPQLFGTRRVGPDLTREAGKHTNDWHFAHLYNPKSVAPKSVMPPYTWYFDKSTTPPTPTKDGVALVAYLQNLGGWAKDAFSNFENLNAIILPPEYEAETE
jgi:cbb3-type cytochrome oxidase cytochrome c subunit